MMFVNPDKSQVNIFDRKNLQNKPTSTKINNININSENSVRLLGLEIDSKLNFDKHITQLCKKSAGQLNALCRLKSFLKTDQRKILVKISSEKFLLKLLSPSMALLFQKVDE